MQTELLKNLPIVQSFGMTKSTLVCVVVAVLFGLLLSAHAVKMMLIPDFEYRMISMKDFIEKWNWRSRLFILMEAGLSIISFMRPVRFYFLFAQIFIVFVFDLWMLIRKRVDLECQSVIKRMRWIKVEAVVKLLIFFSCLVTCAIKIIIVYW
jgi:hypothetical protein